jgi:hypothetical protein
VSRRTPCQAAIGIADGRKRTTLSVGTPTLNDALRFGALAERHGAQPEVVSAQHLRYEMNTDFEASTLGAKELTALVAAWRQGAISRDTLLHNLRAGELLPPARTNEKEVELIGKALPIERASATSASVTGEVLTSSQSPSRTPGRPSFRRGSLTFSVDDLRRSHDRQGLETELVRRTAVHNRSTILQT